MGEICCKASCCEDFRCSAEGRSFPRLLSRAMRATTTARGGLRGLGTIILIVQPPKVPLRTPWRAPAHSRARTRFRQCEKGLTRRRDSAARLGSGLEGTAGQPPRSAIAVASTQPSTSPVTAARVADGEPGGGLDGGCGHHANLRRDDQSAPRASTAGIAELGARGDRGRAPALGHHLPRRHTGPPRARRVHQRAR